MNLQEYTDALVKAGVVTAAELDDTADHDGGPMYEAVRASWKAVVLHDEPMSSKLEVAHGRIAAMEEEVGHTRAWNEKLAKEIEAFRASHDVMTRQLRELKRECERICREKFEAGKKVAELDGALETMRGMYRQVMAELSDLKMAKLREKEGGTCQENCDRLEDQNKALTKELEDEKTKRRLGALLKETAGYCRKCGKEIPVETLHHHCIKPEPKGRLVTYAELDAAHAAELEDSSTPGGVLAREGRVAHQQHWALAGAKLDALFAIVKKMAYLQVCHPARGCPEEVALDRLLAAAEFLWAGGAK